MFWWSDIIYGGLGPPLVVNADSLKPYIYNGQKVV